MSLEVSQLSQPIAALSLLGAEHAQIQHLTLKLFFEESSERLLTDGTGVVRCLDPTDAPSASLVTAAAEEIRVSERKQAHGTLERIRRRFHEVAIVPSGDERSARVIVR